MANELKPCPFCGGTDLSSGGDDKFVGYSCKTCQATCPNHYGSRDWNTRPAAPVEGLRTARTYWRFKDGPGPWARLPEGYEPPSDRGEVEFVEYVYRVEAETIIAAKDARIDELEISLEKKTKEASSVWEDCEFDLRGGDYYACIYFEGQPEKDEIIQTSVITPHKDGSRTILAGVCNEGDRVLISENGIDAKGLMIINRDRYKRLEADNAALTARVKDFEDAIKAKGGNEHSPTQDAYDLACKAIEKHRDHAEALKTQLAAATDILRDWLKVGNKIGDRNEIRERARADLEVKP